MKMKTPCTLMGGSYSRISCIPCSAPRHPLPPYAWPSARAAEAASGTMARVRVFNSSCSPSCTMFTYQVTPTISLISLFSIDHITLHLVTRLPVHSAPLPRPIRSSGDGTRNAREVHGVPALLEPSRQHADIRDSFAVACDESILPSNPFKISVCLPVRILLGVFVQG